MGLFSFNGLRTRYHHLAQSEDVHRRTRGVVQSIQDVLLQFRLSSARIKGGFIGIFLFVLLVVSWSIAGLIGAVRSPSFILPSRIQ